MPSGRTSVVMFPAFLTGCQSLPLNSAVVFQDVFCDASHHTGRLGFLRPIKKILVGVHLVLTRTAYRHSVEIGVSALQATAIFCLLQTSVVGFT